MHLKLAHCSFLAKHSWRRRKRVQTHAIIEQSTVFNGVHPFNSQMIAIVTRSIASVLTANHIAPHSGSWRAVPPAAVIILLPIFASCRLEWGKVFVICSEIVATIGPLEAAVVRIVITWRFPIRIDRVKRLAAVKICDVDVGPFPSHQIFASVQWTPATIVVFHVPGPNELFIPFLLISSWTSSSTTVGRRV